MTSRSIRVWFLVHKWTSLICTAFLLMLCITGLPLIFHDEIEALTEERPALAQTDAPLKSLDEMMAIALASRPGEIGLYVSWDEDRPVVNITTGPHPAAEFKDMTIRSFDQRTGEMVGVIDDSGFLHFLLQLHVDMFLGLPGMLFLGVMGILFFAAIVSGVVLYAPFMRKLPFGTVRTGRSGRLKWLDYHNLLGIVTVAWASVVGLTGVINAFNTPIVQIWQRDQLAALTAAYDQRGDAITRDLASLEAAVATSKAAVPDSRPQFVAFPGTPYSTRHHYGIFLQGSTPLTKELLTPALVDARTGELTAARPMPWYMQALMLSGPLHFGDYGGLPMKILWALLTMVTIVVLGSGLYLWVGKRAPSVEARVREVETGGTLASEAAE